MCLRAQLRWCGFTRCEVCGGERGRHVSGGGGWEWFVHIRGRVVQRVGGDRGGVGRGACLKVEGGLMHHGGREQG
jgi:hypothetical protein